MLPAQAHDNAAPPAKSLSPVCSHSGTSSTERAVDINPERRESWTARLHPAIRRSQLWNTSPFRSSQPQNTYWLPGSVSMPWWERPMPHVQPYISQQPIWSAMSYAGNTPNQHKRDHDSAFNDSVCPQFQPNVRHQASHQTPSWGKNMSFIEMLEDPNFPKLPNASSEARVATAPQLVCNPLTPSSWAPRPSPATTQTSTHGTQEVPPSNSDDNPGSITNKLSSANLQPATLQLSNKPITTNNTPGTTSREQTPAVPASTSDSSQQPRQSTLLQCLGAVTVPSAQPDRSIVVEPKTTTVPPAHSSPPAQSNPLAVPNASVQRGPSSQPTQLITCEVATTLVHQMPSTPRLSTVSPVVPIDTGTRFQITENRNLGRAIVVDTSDQEQPQATIVTDLQRRPSLYSIPAWSPSVPSIPPSNGSVGAGLRPMPDVVLAPTSMHPDPALQRGQFHGPQMVIPRPPEIIAPPTPMPRTHSPNM